MSLDTPPAAASLALLRRIVRAIAGRRTFVYNPQRRVYPTQPTTLRLALAPFTWIALRAGFVNIDYSYVHGPVERLHMGSGCSLMNTTFNVVSGEIWIDDDTLFSHGCYVLTGVHRFYDGQRASLQSSAPYEETPRVGRDIRIGSGCFIGANATILGGVTLGDNVIIGAGAVVTKDVPSGAFVAGIPASAISVRDRLPDSGPPA